VNLRNVFVSGKEINVYRGQINDADFIKNFTKRWTKKMTFRRKSFIKQLSVEPAFTNLMGSGKDFREFLRSFRTLHAAAKIRQFSRLQKTATFKSAFDCVELMFGYADFQFVIFNS
jgi:hypothetical protein